MQKVRRVVLACVIGAAASLTVARQTQAQSLSGFLTVDNAFTAYLSTSATTLGTQIASGSNWQAMYSFGNVPLTSGQNYWLQVMGTDYGYPASFVGSFSLNGGGFQFSNGQQTLTTNVTDWVVSATGFGAGNSTPFSWGTNGVGPWGTFSNIPSTADVIWSADKCGSCTRYFETAIVSTSSTVPEPSTYALMAAGLVAVGMVSRRRRNVV